MLRFLLIVTSVIAEVYPRTSHAANALKFLSVVVIHFIIIVVVLFVIHFFFNIYVFKSKLD